MTHRTDTNSLTDVLLQRWNLPVQPHTPPEAVIHVTQRTKRCCPPPKVSSLSHPFSNPGAMIPYTNSDFNVPFSLFRSGIQYGLSILAQTCPSTQAISIINSQEIPFGNYLFTIIYYLLSEPRRGVSGAGNRTRTCTLLAVEAEAVPP